MDFQRVSSEFQPTRPLRGATEQENQHRENSSISTHAPLAGRDKRLQEQYSILTRFQPTRPLRGATADVLVWQPHHLADFNPRAPCGARRRAGAMWRRHAIFQPTRPLRGATTDGSTGAHWSMISTHAPLAGRDSRASAGVSCFCIFQPTRPLRGATVLALDVPDRRVISTHAPLAGRDDHCTTPPCESGISTHAPLAGRD